MAIGAVKLTLKERLVFRLGESYCIAICKRILLHIY